MTAGTLRLDLNEARVRTRWTMSVSVVTHALLFLWIVLGPKDSTLETPITEITLLDPGELAAAAASAEPAPAAAAAQSSPGLAARNTEDVRFVRRNTAADLTPDPQSAAAIEDRLNSRLAAIQQVVPSGAVGLATTPAPSALFGTGLANATGGSPSGSAKVSLSRGGDGAGPAIALSRGGGGHGLAPALLSGGTAAEKAAASTAPAQGGDATARRTIAGASLAGPIADRPVLSYTTPAYPEWAKKEAVEGSVTLYFVVRPDGGVKENVLVQKTAGFEDFDESARTALRAWRFEPLRNGRTGEQWGTITFHFRLRNAG
jgi:TonB family protein